MKEIKHMLIVRCMTYNHAPYIERAMDGFCMQQTTFPFVCAIIDDCSTDGEPQVVKNYLEKNFDLEDKKTVRIEETCDYQLIFARHKENYYCFFVVIFLKYNHYQIRKAKNPYLKEWFNCKYIAFCEGDDYWTDPMKLQMQVDSLEKYEKCSSSFHKASAESGKQYYTYPKKNILTAKDIILHHMIPTASLVVRTCCYTNVKSFNLSFGDISTEIQIALQGNVLFDNKEMSCYRDNNPTSITHKRGQGRRGLKDSVRVYYYLLINTPISRYSIFLVYRLVRSILLYPRNYYMLYKSNKL